MEASFTIDEANSPGSTPGVLISTQIVMRRYNSSDVLINEYFSPFFVHTTNSAMDINSHVFEWINMDEGDYLKYIVVYAQSLSELTHPTYILINFPPTGPNSGNTWFKCLSSRVALEDNVPTSGSDRRIVKTRTEYPVEWDQMKNYLNDTVQQIRLQNQRINRTGWNDVVKYNFVTGKAEISILNNF